MGSVTDDLKAIETFAGLGDTDLGALAGICEAVQYPPRSILAEEGFDADRLFALTAGTVGIWVDHGSEDADLLAVLEAPCLVGEMAVADQLPRSATIVTGSPVAGYAIDAAAFRRLLEEKGTIALSLDLEPTRGLREALETPARIDNLFISSATAKLSASIRSATAISASGSWSRKAQVPE